MTTLIEATCSRGTMALEGNPPHPDTWGRTQGTSTSRIKPGESWAQWQLRSYCKNRGIPESFIEQVIYAEWIPDGMPEGYLTALQTLACGEPWQLDLSNQCNIADLLMFPRNDQDRSEAQVIVNAVLTLRHSFAPGVPRRGDAQWHELISSTAKVLEPRLQPHLRSQAKDQAMMLLDLRYRESTVERVLGEMRASMLICLVALLGAAMEHGERAGYELGFSRRISAEELESLRFLREQLGEKMLESDENLADHPLAAVMGLMTPERLLSFALLVEEYNLEWAVASFEWDKFPVMPG